MIVFFLVVFPLNILIRSFASTVATLYAWRKAGEPHLTQLSPHALEGNTAACIKVKAVRTQA